MPQITVRIGNQIVQNVNETQANWSFNRRVAFDAFTITKLNVVQALNKSPNRNQSLQTHNIAAVKTGMESLQDKTKALISA